MSVSELLAKQDEGFVSLHDLLNQMAAAGNRSTIEDAAAYLCRILRQHDAPAWHTRTRTAGVQPVVSSKGGQHRGWSLLTYTANHGWEGADDIPF